MAKRPARKRPANAWEKRVIRELSEAGLLDGDPSDPRYMLNLAIGYGETAEALRLLDLGINVNERDEQDPDRPSFFHKAVMRGNLELVKSMLQRGADPNSATSFGTALHYAGRHGHEQVFEYLRPRTDPVHHRLADRYLEDGERRPLPEREAIFRLWFECKRGRGPTVAKLLAQGADLNASTFGLRGASALHGAAEGGQLAMVRLLLKAGANPNAEDYGGETPLAGAATAEVCKALLKAGADVNHRDQLGRTPVMWAFDDGVFRRLVKAGAEMTAVDERGMGAVLHIAHKVQIRKSLSPKAMKTDAAFDKKLASIYRQLIKAGVPVHDCFPGDGVTALMLVASLDLQQCTKLLLKAGADARVTDHEGKTAQAYAKPRSPLRKLLRDAEHGSAT